MKDILRVAAKVIVTVIVIAVAVIVAFSSNHIGEDDYTKLQQRDEIIGKKVTPVKANTEPEIKVQTYEELLNVIDSLECDDLRIFVWNSGTGLVRFYSSEENVYITSADELLFIYHQDDVTNIKTSTDEYFFVDSDSKKASMVGLGCCNFSNMKFIVTTISEREVVVTTSVNLTVDVDGFEEFDPNVKI